MTQSTQYQEINDLLSKNKHYKEGFFTKTLVQTFDKGLNEDIVRAISAKKNEPQWMLDFRLKAFKHWLTMVEPHWAKADYTPIDYQDYSYYSAPECGSCDQVCDKALDGKDHSQPMMDPEVAKAFASLGVPIDDSHSANIAVDAIFDSVSVSTTKRGDLAKLGIIFCSFSEAVHDYPEMVQQYIGSVVPYHDNFFAALNSAVASDGTFVYIPPGVRCPIDLSTYFRINEAKTGQFERTIVIADKGSYVSYLEGCSAPVRDSYQLHAAVVEVIVHEDAQVKYSTVQNWYPGDDDCRGGILNFVTKRGICEGKNSKLSWTQAETGSAITWKYPSCILKGDNSIGEFYSVALTNRRQQADTGTKMIHIGKNTAVLLFLKAYRLGAATIPIVDW